MLKLLPLILTFSRLILAPLIFPVLFITLLPLNNFFINLTISVFFSLFSITDFFDGYFARKYNWVTEWGCLLDPIADKIFVSSSLIGLLSVNKVSVFVVLIIICREFLVSGLRQFCAQKQIVINSSKLAKLKTTFQMMYIVFAIINTSYQKNFLNSLNIVHMILASIVIFLTIFSSYKYFIIFYKNVLKRGEF
jgi:CDP-diacylglycerol---glycerol-3-phosphate 3-phosphatidyltransferase